MIDISRPHHSAVRAAAVVLVSLTLYACDSAGAGTGGYPADPSDLGLIQDAMKQVEKNYVAPVTGGELAKDALKGMLTRLDPHSDYMDQEQYQQMTAVTRGQFGGIGVELTLEGKVPEVISPIDGTPAAEAGIEPGDRIVKIDALPTTGMDVEEVVKRLRGPPGSRVTLSIARNDRGAFDVTLTRNVIRVVSVKSDLKPNNIGYARITTFTENTASELAGAIERMKTRTQGRLNGFILDLRNDPGGLLDASIDVAGDFLDGGDVVTNSRPQHRRRPCLPRSGERRHAARDTHRSADQQRLGIGCRNRRRRLAGPPPRDRHGNPQLWQGLGADDNTVGGPRRAPPDDCAILHAVRPFHSGPGHFARYRRQCPEKPTGGKRRDQL